MITLAFRETQTVEFYSNEKPTWTYSQDHFDPGQNNFTFSTEEVGGETTLSWHRYNYNNYGSFVSEPFVSSLTGVKDDLIRSELKVIEPTIWNPSYVPDFTGSIYALSFRQVGSDLFFDAYQQSFSLIVGYTISGQSYFYTYFEPDLSDKYVQTGPLTDISFSGGTNSDELQIGQVSYQVQWATNKTIVMATGFNVTADVTRLYGFVFDRTDTVEVINIAELPVANFSEVRMVGNYSGETPHVAAVLVNGNTKLYRLEWEPNPWDSGGGTFTNTQEEVTFDDAEIASDLANGFLTGMATDDGCNYMLALKPGNETGLTKTPYMIVIDRNWVWYDKVTIYVSEYDYDGVALLEEYASGSTGGTLGFGRNENVKTGYQAVNASNFSTTDPTWLVEGPIYYDNYTGHGVSPPEPTITSVPYSDPLNANDYPFDGYHTRYHDSGDPADENNYPNPDSYMGTVVPTVYERWGKRQYPGPFSSITHQSEVMPAPGSGGSWASPDGRRFFPSLGVGYVLLYDMAVGVYRWDYHITYTIPEQTAEVVRREAYSYTGKNLYLSAGHTGNFKFCYADFDACDVAELGVAPEEPTESTVKVRAWTFTLDDHDFFCLKLGTGETVIYDTLAEQWYNWADGTGDTWRAQTGINWVGGSPYADEYGSNVLVGDSTKGVLYFMDPNGAYDENVDDALVLEPFTRVAQAQITVSGRDSKPCYGIQLLGSLGDVDYEALTSVELFMSDDGGRTYTSCGALNILPGEYNTRVEWNSLGSIRMPGRLFKIVDAGALTRIDGLDLLDDSSES